MSSTCKKITFVKLSCSAVASGYSDTEQLHAVIKVFVPLKKSAKEGFFKSFLTIKEALFTKILENQH